MTKGQHEDCTRSNKSEFRNDESFLHCSSQVILIEEQHRNALNILLGTEWHDYHG